MKKYLYIYAALIVIFLAYNFFFRVEDPRTDAALNIILTSVIFGFISVMGVALLRRMKK